MGCNAEGNILDNRFKPLPLKVFQHKIENPSGLSGDGKTTKQKWKERLILELLGIDKSQLADLYKGESYNAEC